MSRPASWWRVVGAQVASEVRLTLRRGENLLAMVAIPGAALLVAWAAPGDAASSDRTLASTMALAIVASGLVNLGIATAYERGYGVLKRLGSSPLGRSGLVASKVTVVVAIAVLQVGGLLVVATLLGWRPADGFSAPLLAIGTIVGAVTFAGLGMAIAGLLRPEGTLVVANVLFLLALVFGGPVGELIALPEAVASASRLLPSGALTDAFSAASGTPGADPVAALVTMLGWALAGSLVASRAFRWE